MALTAFLDADVLYPAVLRDVLLSLAEAGVCQIRLSPDVLDEMERNVGQRAKAPDPSVARAGARYLREIMERAFLDSIVPREAYAPLTPVMANHPKDRHVLAAAVAGRADVLVTSTFPIIPQTHVVRTELKCRIQTHSSRISSASLQTSSSASCRTLPPNAGRPWIQR